MVSNNIGGWTREMPIDWATVTEKQPALRAIPRMLRDAARQCVFVKGQVLFRRGQRPEAMLCILSGEVRLVRSTRGGSELILHRTQGGFIAEASLDTQHYHCDVIAASDGSLVMFPRTAFQAALDNEPGFNRAWMRVLAQEIRRLRAQSERLTLHGAADRILHYIETEGENGRIVLNRTRKAWAAELGLTHEVLYRTLRQLREGGVILIDGKQIALSTSGEEAGEARKGRAT